MTDIMDTINSLQDRIGDLEDLVKNQQSLLDSIGKTQLSYPLDSTSTSIVNSAVQKLVDNGLGIQKEAYFDQEVENGNSGTAISIDWRQGNKQELVLTGNCTITFVNPDGACNLILKAVNFGAFTPTFTSTIKYPSGATPTWTAAGTDIMALYFDGRVNTPTYYAIVSNNFS